MEGLRGGALEVFGRVSGHFGNFVMASQSVLGVFGSFRSRLRVPWRRLQRFVGVLRLIVSPPVAELWRPGGSRGDPSMQEGVYLSRVLGPAPAYMINTIVRIYMFWVGGALSSPLSTPHLLWPVCRRFLSCIFAVSCFLWLGRVGLRKSVMRGLVAVLGYLYGQGRSELHPKT